MKKKILIFTIILTLMITFAPSTVSAANNKVFNQKRITERKKFMLTKPTKAQIKAVGSELEYYKQTVLEDIDNIYFSYQEKGTDNYSDEISTLIESYYNQISDEINSVTEESQIVSGVVNFLGIMIPVPSNGVLEKLYTFDTLTMFTKDIIASMGVDEYKKEIIDVVTDGFDCYLNESNLYNEYYKGLLQTQKTKYLDLINNSTDWLSLASALGAARPNLEEYESLWSFSNSLELVNECPFDYEEDEEDYYDDYEEHYANLFGINTAPNAEIGKYIYTIKEVDALKEVTTVYLDNYMNRQLVDANYSVSTDLKNLYDNAIKEIKKGYNADEILSIYDRTLEKLVTTSGLEYKDYTIAKYKRYIKKLNELKKQYTDSNAYGDEGLIENENIIYYATTLIDMDNIYKDSEIPSDFIERVTAALEETPTYEEELANTKDNLIAELNYYRNKKKYNQTKVVPIIDEGIKKIKNAKTINSAWNIYYTYDSKAEKTIYKFKITTSKVGKGTISKSATIKYGNSYTVKIKPTVGYKISAIYVDGKKVKLTEKYTFKNITKKHTIKVIFK